MSPLQDVLASYRHRRLRARKGTYFEDLIRTYLRNEGELPRSLFRGLDLRRRMGPKSQWTGRHDTGIDLVARTQGANELHAIQAKLRAGRIQKKDIDSFFTVGKRAFKRRIIVAT